MSTTTEDQLELAKEALLLADDALSRARVRELLAQSEGLADLLEEYAWTEFDTQGDAELFLARMHAAAYRFRTWVQPLIDPGVPMDADPLFNPDADS